MIDLNIKIEKTKTMDMPGFEPGAFRMQSERDTTTPHTHFKHYATNYP